MNGDKFYRFIFEEAALRGQIVTLDESWRQALQQHAYPEQVSAYLGQAMAASLLLSATIKNDGSLILQTKTDGPLYSVVAEATHDRTVRGLARWQPDSVLTESDQLLGEGYLALTISPKKGERYQGVVAMKNESLSSAIVHYFDQSEQLLTYLWLAADNKRATGLMLQALPSETPLADAQQRVMMLASTVTQAELLDLDSMALIHKLFHEEKIRLFESQPVRFQCHCSKERVENTLRTLGEVEVNDILKEKGRIDVNCEFCNAHYSFDRVDAAALFSTDLHLQQGDTRH